MTHPRSKLNLFKDQLPKRRGGFDSPFRPAAAPLLLGLNFSVSGPNSRKELSRFLQQLALAASSLPAFIKPLQKKRALDAHFRTSAMCLQIACFGRSIN